MTDGRERCIKRFVRNVKKNAKSLLNPAEIVRSTAKTVIQNEKTAAVKRAPP